jgi:CO/xanthine dehydrogenase Mo-binding subunit
MSAVGEAASEGLSNAHPILASQYVSYVDQPIAAVVSDDQYTAEDLADQVQIEYEPLTPVIDPEWIASSKRGGNK